MESEWFYGELKMDNSRFYPVLFKLADGCTTYSGDFKVYVQGIHICLLQLVGVDCPGEHVGAVFLVAEIHSLSGGKLQSMSLGVGQFKPADIAVIPIILGHDIGNILLVDA